MRVSELERLCGATCLTGEYEDREIACGYTCDLLSHVMGPVSYTHLDVYKRQALFGLVLLRLA